MTPLAEAASKGHTEVVKPLLDKGAKNAMWQINMVGQHRNMLYHKDVSLELFLHQILNDEKQNKKKGCFEIDKDTGKLPVLYRQTLLERFIIFSFIAF